MSQEKDSSPKDLSGSSALSKRCKGVVYYRPIVYGNTASPLKKLEGSNTHEWVVYVRGLHNEDISYYIQKVEFKLHESFANCIRVVENWPFEVHEQGWGEFEVIIKIHFVDSNEKTLILSHFLRLYHLDEPFQIKFSPNKNLVRTEQYDEIMFYDPTPLMGSLLSEPEYMERSCGAFVPGSAYEETKTIELSRLQNAKKKIQNEIEKEKQKFIELQKKLSQ